jgi:hypothetical protein
VSDRAGPGLQLENVSRGLAIGDLDNDGDHDVVISNMDAAPTLLQNRQNAGHHWAGFRVDKPGRNRFAIGARIVVSAGEQHQACEIRSGGSYVSQNDLRCYVGLGAHEGTVDVQVRVPGGGHWKFSDLATDRLHVLTLANGSEVTARALPR